MHLLGPHGRLQHHMSVRPFPWTLRQVPRVSSGRHPSCRSRRKRAPAPPSARRCAPAGLPIWPPSEPCSTRSTRRWRWRVSDRWATTLRGRAPGNGCWRGSPAASHFWKAIVAIARGTVKSRRSRLAGSTPLLARQKHEKDPQHRGINRQEAVEGHLFACVRREELGEEQDRNCL